MHKCINKKVYIITLEYVCTDEHVEYGPINYLGSMMMLTL